MVNQVSQREYTLDSGSVITVTRGKFVSLTYAIDGEHVAGIQAPRWATERWIVSTVFGRRKGFASLEDAHAFALQTCEAHSETTQTAQAFRLDVAASINGLFSGDDDGLGDDDEDEREE